MRQHGRSYFLATKVLSREQRDAVHALYAFARMVDDVVDEGVLAPQQQADYLDWVEESLRSGFRGERLTDPVLEALCDTVTHYGIAHECFWAFLSSMRMDIPGTPEHRTRYHTMEDLRGYMYGSAAVIGLELLPVFGAQSADAQRGATALGYGFQMTNFLRDVADDYHRGRIYLPLAELAPFGVTEEVIAACVDNGAPDDRMVRGLAHLIAVTRSYYRAAAASLPALTPAARLCVDTALRLYGEILSEIERADHNVFAGRVIVPNRRRLRIAGPRITRAVMVRHRSG